MGPAQAQTTIGEVTENLHRYLLDNWDLDRAPPRIEEDYPSFPRTEKKSSTSICTARFRIQI